MLRLGLVLLLASTVAYAQQQPQPQGMPSGKQYLAAQVASCEARVAEMFDEIAALKRQLDLIRKPTETKP